jgi:glycerol-1-phosphate dehydrogenase [NAD(P)+]
MKIDLSLSHSINLPFIFEITQEPEADLERIAGSWDVFRERTPRILLLTGATNATKSVGELYQHRLSTLGKHVCQRREVGEASLEQVRQLDELCARAGIELIVAIGGGKVIDVAKMVITKRNAALMIIPTALSSDCIASPIAVLKDDQGHTTSIPSGISSCVFIDLHVTIAAPPHFALSGMGDILSNASALHDLREYEQRSKVTVSGFAKMLAETAYKNILTIDSSNHTLIENHRQIGQGLILSGLAMAFAGNSLPCSGAEHLISHALDHLGYGNGTHGLQVGLSTIYCGALRQLLQLPAIDPEAIRCLKSLGLASHPERIGVSREQFLEAVRLAPEMRKGRVTVLSSGLSPDTLGHAYDLAFSE